MSTGGGGGDTETTIRYYSGIEDAYNKLRGLGWTETQALYHDSPFATGFDVIAPEDAFFAAGYVVSDFPSMYDMFGKFMAGLDIEVLRSQIQLDFIRGTVSDELKNTNRVMLNDETDNVILPKLKASYQTMNAVMSSSFIDSISTVYSNQLKRINEYNATIDMRMLELATQWAMKHLDWNTQVITHYYNIATGYLQANANYLSHKSQMTSLDKLWPFTVLDHYRAIVGCLNGAQGATSAKSTDPWSKALGGALGGAAMGGMVGSAIGGTIGGTAVGTLASGELMMSGGIAAGPAGAIAGALIGLGMGFLS